MFWHSKVEGNWIRALRPITEIETAERGSGAVVVCGASSHVLLRAILFVINLQGRWWTLSTVLSYKTMGVGLFSVPISTAMHDVLLLKSQDFLKHLAARFGFGQAHARQS